MRPRCMTCALLGCVLAVWVPIAAAQDGERPRTPEEAFPGVTWKRGVAEGKLGQQAKISIPKGFIFTDAKGATRVLEDFGNLTDGTEQGLIAPQSLQWFVVFEFDEVGYVKDNEELDARKIWKSLKEGQDAANEELRARGLSELRLVSWVREPSYDPVTQQLSWATLIESDGHEGVNYNTRRLGREGVMRVTLVTDAGELDAVMPEFETLMNGYGFVSKKRYDEFQEGDRIAQYGLAALITGGAAAVALKTGLFKKFWKLMVIGVVALGGAVKALWSKITMRG